VNDAGSDDTVRRLRREISEQDLAIIGAVNARIELVARLKRYKDEQGIPFLDPDRERQLLDELARVNRGPLSPEGLHELYTGLLDLTKREVAGGDGGVG
jgi:chorismate mutase/prephenate dehydratase